MFKCLDLYFLLYCLTKDKHSATVVFYTQNKLEPKVIDSNRDKFTVDNSSSFASLIYSFLIKFII